MRFLSPLHMAVLLPSVPAVALIDDSILLFHPNSYSSSSTSNSSVKSRLHSAVIH
ncbi:hypothetical protein LINPERPRIM_LOCUS35831 [Linum perenne]